MSPSAVAGEWKGKTKSTGFELFRLGYIKLKLLNTVSVSTVAHSAFSAIPAAVTAQWGMPLGEVWPSVHLQASGISGVAQGA